MERLYHMESHWLANQTVIQLEKTLTDNTDAGAMPSWHDTTANYQTYDIGQIFKHLHDKPRFQVFNTDIQYFDKIVHPIHPT